MRKIRSLKDLGAGAWKVAKEAPASRSKGSTSGARLKAANLAQVQEVTPHDLLWSLVSKRWPQAQREFKGAVPGRRFRLDIGFPFERLAVEVDGFAHHGKFLADFKRDRERQNELVIAGWRVLRFSAGEIRQNMRGCMHTIERALSAQQEEDADEQDQ